MERSIDELLGDEKEPEAPEPETKPEAEAEAEDRPRDEHGRFLPKQTGVEEEPEKEPEAEKPKEAGPPPADQLPQDVYEPLKAIRSENKELKQQIEALNQRFAAKPEKEEEPPVDFWDNPSSVIAKEAKQAAQLAIQEFQQQQQVERINQSEAKAKAQYNDYDDAFRAFQQIANPELIQQMTSASDPAEFAYKKGKTALDLERVGSIDELLKSERAKWEAELKASAPQQSFPSTTAADGSVGSRSGPEWAGPKSIEDLLG